MAILQIATSSNTEISRIDADRNVEQRPRIMRTDRRMDDPETSPRTFVTCWKCRKSFRTVKGLRIHQTRMGCRYEGGRREAPAEVLHRPDDVHSLDNAQDDSRLESNHSVAAESIADQTNTRRPPIMWPAMSDLKVWSQVDDDLVKVLNVELKGDVTHKLQMMSNTIYSYGAERFGCKESRTRPEGGGLSRRQQAIHNIRKELREVTNQWKEANKNGNLVEMEGLDELRGELRSKLKSLRRAERVKRKRKERERKRKKFFQNPFQFTKELFDKARSGTLSVSQDELEDHLRRTYSDPIRNDPLPPIHVLSCPSHTPLLPI